MKMVYLILERRGEVFKGIVDGVYTDKTKADQYVDLLNKNEKGNSFYYLKQYPLYD